MSQAKANIESSAEGAVQGVGTVAEEARTQLSNEFVQGVGSAMGRNAQQERSHDGQRHLDKAPDQTPAQRLLELVGDEKFKNPISGLPDRIGDRITIKPRIDWDYPVNDKDRAEAKDQLAKDLHELIPAGDKALLKDIDAALIDGDLNALKKSLATLANDADPEKLGKFIKAVNDQFAKKGFNGVELSQDGKGNVLVYQKDGSTAISINPKTGDTTLRAIERQFDGSVVIKPGEIINRQPGDVMKSVSEEATRAVLGPRFEKRIYDEGFGRPWPRGGGGIGGGIRQPFELHKFHDAKPTDNKLGN